MLFGGINLPGRTDLDNIRRLDLLPTRAIMEMERYGIAIDVDHLNQVSRTLAVEMEELRKDICSYIPPSKLDEFIARSNLGEDADEDSPMNVDSNLQLHTLLFDTLGIGEGRQLKRTKSGDRISTGKRQLEQLRNSHPVVPLVLKYRERAKLKSTYTDTLPLIARSHDAGLCWCGLKHGRADKRVHTHVLSTRADTGRYACVAPWTEIETLRGKIPIRNIVIGDHVLTHKLRWRKVTAIWIKGYDEMYDVRFSTGKVLTCTNGHRLLVCINGHIEKMVDGRGERDCGIGNVSEFGVTNYSADSGESRSDISYDTVGITEQDAKGRIQSVNEVPLLKIEDCGEEPDVREVWGEASQLDRYYRRWVRISNLSSGWEASVCPSFSDGGVFRARVLAGNYGCPSYRRQQEEQQDRQSSISNEGWASGSTRDASQGQSFCLIKEIKPAGRFEVYDISVEEDESYLASGVFSHNSKNPNLQNIPIRSTLGGEIRKAFIPGYGMVFIESDFSQIELRALAHLAQALSMIRVYLAGGDIHDNTAREVFDLGADVKPDKIKHRMASKRVNFGIQNGTTEVGLYAQLVMDYCDNGLEVPDWLTLEWCKWFIRKWLKTYPEVEDYFDLQHYRAFRYGMVWDSFGRIKRIPEVKSVHKYICQSGLRQAQNMPVTAFAAELMKLAIAETQLWIETEVRPQGIQCQCLITVHDSLLIEVEEEWAEVVKEYVEGVFARVLVDKDTGVDYCSVPILAEGKIMERWEK